MIYLVTEYASGGEIFGKILRPQQLDKASTGSFLLLLGVGEELHLRAVCVCCRPPGGSRSDG